MYLKKIELKNIKSFDHFEWGLPPGVPAAGWHVLLGDNGSGKSSLLGACAAALLGDKETLALRLNLAEWVTRGESEGRIVLTLEQDPQWDGWSGKGRTSGGGLEAGIRIGADEILRAVDQRRSADRHIWGGGKGWFSAAFGPFRRFTGGGPEYAKLFYSNPKLARHLSIFGEDVAFTETLSWLKQLRFEQLEQGGIDRRSWHPETADPETFDCLLSHNSRDKPAVRALANALRDRGISVWLDEEQLRPGLPWEPQLESAIRASRSVAVLVGADGLGPLKFEDMQLALALAFKEGRPVIPVLLADAPAVPELPVFLHERTWVDLRPEAETGTGTLPGLDRLIWGITGKRPDRNGDRGQAGASGRADGDDLLDAIKAFVNQPDFLPNDTRLSEVNSKEVVFVDSNGYRVPIESLSDGFRSILSMTLELIRQLAEVYGTRKVFSDENTRVIPPGVVLIDEVDVHLHPRWQRLVGPWLTDHFPNMQFLVTTHSPLVCQGAEKGSVTRLPQPGTGDRGGPITGIALNRLVYGDILEALSSGAFGDEVGRSDTGEAKLEQLARLNVKALHEGLDQGEQGQRRELQEIFGGNANLMETDRVADPRG